MTFASWASEFIARPNLFRTKDLKCSTTAARTRLLTTIPISDIGVWCTLALQDGPCILVAHSYGGSVITEAGTDPSVAGLVYIAAHMPDTGENEADDGKRFPSNLSKSGAIKKTADGFTYLDPTKFHEYFAADLSAEQAAFMARSQVPNFADNFKAVITMTACRNKPSWVLVATKDRIINPDLERWYATRAKSHTVEAPGASHAVYVSRPKEIAALIEEAAAHGR